MAQDCGRHHLRRGVVAEQKDRQAVVLAAFGLEHFLQDLPTSLGVLGAVHRDQPAGFRVEDVNEPAGILVVDPADDAKALLLDRLRERPHAAARGPLALEVLVDDCDRKALVELHMLLPTE